MKESDINCLIREAYKTREVIFDISKILKTLEKQLEQRKLALQSVLERIEE